MTETIHKNPYRIVVAGPCLIGDCDCAQHEGRIVEKDYIEWKPDEWPPYHDGCTCYGVPVEEARDDRDNADP